jgi:hypothetical protein
VGFIWLYFSSGSLFILDLLLGLFYYDPYFYCLLPIYNAYTDKLLILSNNKAKPGIYCFTNLINGKQYVGSAIDLSKRLRNYFNTKYLARYPYMYIYNALQKHGHENFSLEILEYCEVEKCIEREDDFIKLLKPEYNILPKAGSSLGYKHTDKAREKMSNARKGIPKSEQHKLAITLAQPNSQKILVIDLEENTTTSYNSIREAARTLDIP